MFNEKFGNPERSGYMNRFAQLAERYGGDDEMLKSPLVHGMSEEVVGKLEEQYTNGQSSQ